MADAPRTILITGASGGIGSVLVDAFLGQGDRVIATDIDDARLTHVSRAREAGRLRAFAADQSREEDCAALARFVAEEAEKLDVLVNCAGYFPRKPFEAMTAGEWRRVIDINLTGVFLVVQALLPQLKKSDRGRIINYGSGSFFKGSPDQAHYISAKAGIIGLTRCLATELGGYGITCNVVTPGVTLTGPVRETFPQELLARRRAERPLQRDQHPDDLVGVTLFLASAGASFITGQIINIDGGSVKH